MTRDPNAKQDLAPGYTGEEDANSLGRRPPSPLRTAGQSEEENRGQRAPKEGSGVVIGSGAGDGGGGNAEDFDGDAAGGSQELG